MRVGSRALGVAAVAAVLACEEGGSLNGPSVIGLSVSVSPKLDTIFATDTVQPTDAVKLVATVHSVAAGTVSVPVTWSSSAPSVASVDATGLVTAVGFGDATITADIGGKTSTSKVTVAHATSSVALTPSAVTISVDDPIGARDTVRLQAVARDRNGRVVPGTRITWRTSSASLASVDSAGLVRAVALGTGTVTATGAGVSGNASLVVRTLVKAVTVTSPVSQALVSDTVQLTAAATGQNDAALASRTFTWQSSNPSVATVNSAGRVLIVGQGTAQITATTGFVSGSTSIEVLPRALVAVDAGGDFSCAVANLGRGYCWGDGSEGQLGVEADSLCFDGAGGDPTPCTISPQRFADGVTIRSISSGGQSACAIGSDSHAYCWGSDAAGQLGDGQRGTPVSGIVRATVGTVRFKAVTVGGAHACAISTTDTAYCWGADESGQLGDNRRINSTTPIPLAPNFGNMQWARLSAGDTHTCGVTLTGEAWCWGNNERGQLGNGTTATSEVPVLVSGGRQYAAISAGGRHTCAATTTGAVYCWGEGREGQLGDGRAQTDSVPVEAGPLTGAAEVSTGQDHSCARLTSGAVWCWGLNDWGQIGNGSITGQGNRPAVVSGGPAYVSITAGSRHTCAVGGDGNSYCWGSNVYGALGNELQAAPRGQPQRVARPR